MLPASFLRPAYVPPPAPDWNELLNSAVLALGPGRFERLYRRTCHTGLARGVWWELEGAKAPVPMVIRPRILTREQRSYIRRVSWHVRCGLERAAWLAARDPRAAALLPLDAEEREWFERFPPRRPAPAFCRLDATVGLGADWRARLQFVEANVVGIGGMTYAPVLERLARAQVLPALARAGVAIPARRNADPRELLLAEILEHARRRGVTGRPTIALLDDRSLYAFGGELGRQEARLRARGFDALYLDPHELEVSRSGDLSARGRRVDVCYRFITLADLVQLERRGQRLDGLRAAFARDMVLPGVGGDLEHKSVLELMTDSTFRGAFDPLQQSAFDAHVLWTRLVQERRTTAPDGAEIDLLPWAAANQRRLVLKPNRLDGGEGVLFGAGCEAARWVQALHAAATCPGTQVVQAASPPDLERFPRLRPSGDLQLDGLYTTTGLFPGRGGLGIFGRYAERRVVNICQGGGVLPMLVCDR
jgi:GNAT superfamily N-acetyltransferase